MIQRVLLLLTSLVMVQCEPFDAGLEDYNHSGWSEHELWLAPHLTLTDVEREGLLEHTKYDVPDNEKEIVEELLNNSTLHELSDMISEVTTTKGAEIIAREMSKIVKSTPDIHDPLMTSLKLLTGDSFDNFHHRLRRSASVCVGGGTTYLDTIVIIGHRPKPPVWPVNPWPVNPWPSYVPRCPPYCGGGGGPSPPKPTQTMSTAATTAGGKGESVVDEVTASVDKVLGDTNGFLKKIAYVESRFGEDSSTYRKGYEGGIFQMDSIGFKDTQNTASHPGLTAKFAKIQTAYGINWKTVTWSDMRKPLYSTIGARLLLSNKPGNIPSSLSGQATYWKTYYNSGAGKGSAAEFIHRWNAYLNSKKG